MIKMENISNVIHRSRNLIGDSRKENGKYWDFFFFLIQTESHKNYTHPHQFTQSHVINFFFFHLDLLLALL